MPGNALEKMHRNALISHFHPFLHFFISVLLFASFFLDFFIPSFLSSPPCFRSLPCDAFPIHSEAFPMHFQSIPRDLYGLFPFSLSAGLMFGTRTATEGAWQCIHRNEEMKEGMEMAYQCITMRFLQCIPRHLAQRISTPFWKRIYWNYQHVDSPFLQRHWQCISSPFRVHYNAFRGLGNRALRSADLLFGILPGQWTFPSLRDDHIPETVKMYLFGM